MKQFRTVIDALLIILVFQFSTRAQEKEIAIQTRSLAPLHVMISYNKTSNLIFPNEIVGIDIGSSVLLAQKARGVENILQIKAGREGFAQTNLSVVTKGGLFYSFLIDYAKDPAVLNIEIVRDSIAKKSHILLTDSELDQDVMNKVVTQVINMKKFIHVYSEEQKIRCSMSSIYLNENLMWFVLTLSNRSLINYKPESVRFIVRDIKRFKRTAVQETEIQPLFSKTDSVIAGKNSGNAILCFDPFTIPRTKELIVQVAEQNGGRRLELHIRYSALLKARLLH